ncbi:SpoIIE family protein phosphatase [Geodermatophilus sp. DF01_2]|uniref:SpoIIE family protein phosphatase n=1 Tax=Geodermatophilus sp. DF01-2 TaxID=2559610 RepID=UPI001430AD37|nr:SpoIIE family protein phosphatase [Geodermatophilus sp. DF01_2]
MKDVGPARDAAGPHRATGVRTPARLAAVRASGLLDTPREEPFDRLTALAAELLDTPFAFVTVVDDRRSFWKSCLGIPADGPRENTVEESFCQYVVASGEPLVVGETRADPRTAGNPSIESMGVAAWLGYPVHAPGGEVLGTFCVVDTRVRSWTERDQRIVRTLAAAASSEVALRVDLDELRTSSALQVARFRAIAEQTTDLVAMADADGRVTYLNPAGRRIVGLAPDQDLPTTAVVDVLTAASRDLLRSRAVPAAREVGAWAGELEVLGADREPVPLEQVLTAHRDEHGDIAFYAAIGRDVRERRRYEAELHAERQRYETLVGQAPVGIFLADPHGQNVYVNDGLAELVGRPAVEIAGSGWADHVHPDDRAGAAAGWAAAVASGQEWLDEYRVVRPDGTVRLVSASARALHDAAGGVTGFLGTYTDVTEQRDAERARRTAAAEQAARRESDAAAARLQQLARASVEISAAVTTREALEVLTRTARELIGAHRSVSSVTVDEDWSQAITAVSVSPEYRAWEDYGALPAGSGIHSLVCRDNVPVRLTQEELERHPAWRDFGAHGGQHPPMRGWLAAPLVAADGSNLGLVQLSDRYAGEFTAEDEALLVQLAQVGSATLEKAELLRQQTAVGATLQRAILGPVTLPPGFAVRYEPATSGLEVGGDWYDVVPLPGGRYGVVVGDVVGSGLAAAAVMGQLRSAVRALLLEHGAPARALAALDGFAELVPGAKCSTVFCAVVDPATRTLRYSSAGHLPAITVDAGGTPRLLDEAQSLPLAVGAVAARREAEAALPDGSVLLLYTDGLIERRHESLDTGMAQLTALLSAERTRPVETLADLVTERLVGARHDDDVALLVYRGEDDPPPAC